MQDSSKHDATRLRPVASADYMITPEGGITLGCSEWAQSTLIGARPYGSLPTIIKSCHDLRSPRFC